MSDDTLATTALLPEGSRDKARENYDRYLYARERGHDKFIDKYDRCKAFVFDEQWTEEELGFLRKVKRPALTINKIKPAVMAILDDYIKNRAEIKFIPGRNGTDDVASAHTKVYRHISNAEKFEEKEMDLVMDGIIGSRAYYLVRIGFDDNFMGEVRVSVPNPKNIIPDPDSDSRYPSDWNEFIYESHQSIHDIEFNYGKKKAQQLKVFGTSAHRDNYGTDEQDSFSGESTALSQTANELGDPNLQRVYQVIERQYKKLEEVPHFRNKTTGDMRRIPPHWDDDEVEGLLQQFPDLEVVDEQAEVIRWTVSSNGILLHDSLSPYRSFSVVPFFPMFHRGSTSGAVESLLDPQRNYNKLRSSELHIVNGTSNSGWKVKDGSLTNMDVEDLETKGSMTGLVLVFNDSPNDIERIQPVSIPQGMDRISQKADADMREISGIPDDAKTLSAPYASGSRLKEQRSASLVNTTLMFENLDHTRRMLAKKVLELVQAFYTEERKLHIVSKGLNAKVEVLEVNTPRPDGEITNDLTVGEYDVVTTTIPAKDNHEQEQFETLARMQEDLNVPIPSHLFVQYSSLDRKDEIAEEIKQITGTSTPSEEERQLQLEEQRLAQQERRAKIASGMAAAKLSEARAQKVLREIEQIGQLDDKAFEELLRKAEELDIKRFETENAIDIRRQAQVTDMAKALMNDDNEQAKIIIEALAKLQQDSQSKDTTQRGNSNG